MAQKTSDVRVIGIKPSTVGALQGSFLALIGLASGITYTLTETVQMAGSTTTFLEALTFGLTKGFLAIFLTPLIYFFIGWVIGFIQGLFLNALIRVSGGIVLRTTDKEE